MKTSDQYASVLAGIFIMFLALGLIVGFYALSAYILMICWNMALPALFHCPSINFLQALALRILIFMVQPHSSTGAVKNDNQK